MPVKDPAVDPAKDPVAFDSAAFKKELLDEMRKDLQGIAKALKTDLSKLLKPPSDPDPDPDPGDPKPGDPKPGDPKPDPVANTAMLQMQRQIKDLTKRTADLTAERDSERKQKLETERVAAVERAASSIPFKDDKARGFFLKSILPDITRDEDGQLVAKTDSGPVLFTEYIQQQAQSLPDLLAPKGSGGAGARGGKPGASGGGSGQFQFEDITPEKLASMKPEDKQALFQQLQTAAGEAGFKI